MVNDEEQMCIYIYVTVTVTVTVAVTDIDMFYGLHMPRAVENHACIKQKMQLRSCISERLPSSPGHGNDCGVCDTLTRDGSGCAPGHTLRN